MRKIWFYRLLLSYLPVFVLIVSFLLLSSYWILSDMSKKSAVKSNEVLTQHVLQNIDNGLKTVEQAMVQEIFAEHGVSEFMRNPNFTAYDAAMRLKQLKESLEWADSVYLVRDADGTVITETRIQTQDTFEDRAFLQQLKHSNQVYAWTGVRELENGPSGKHKVLSLAKLIHQAPSTGILVVNVSTDRLHKLLGEMAGSGLNYVRLLDADKKVISAIGIADEEGSSRDELSQLKSAYSHYEVRSGLAYISFLDRISSFMYGILALGLVSILLGTAWIIYVSRRNYKPVERILNRINPIVKGAAGSVAKRQDEFNLIESAIERMAEDSARFEKRHEEDLLYKRQVLFLELLEGKQHLHEFAPDSFHPSEFGLEAGSGALQAAVIEIDGYAAFTEKFSEQDRSLLKLVLEKSANEIALSQELPILTDWTAPHRFSMLFQLPAKQAAGQDILLKVCSELLQWTEQHLSFTVTASIGTHVEGMDDVSRSYTSAITQLQYKPSLGNNRVIQPADFLNRPHLDMYRIVQLVHPFIQAFKLGERDWPELLHRFFDELKQGIFARTDLESLMHYTVYQFHRAMMELSEEFRSLWERETMPKLERLSERMDTLELLQQEMTAILTDVSQTMKLTRERRNHHLMLKQMRAYMEEQYGNPDMSLTMLGDVFGLNPKYLSRLFKEEFGENFGEFMVNVRMEQAKRYLSESSDSIQDIALKVGYTTSIAFIRVFKKTTGVTPGDFRREMKIG